MTYGEKLLDPRWQKKRLEVLQRDEFECKRCFTNNNILNVHHLRYVKGHEPWEYVDIDLITLCQLCHKSVTAFPVSEEETKNPWLIYERMKKMISKEFSPGGYERAILSLCNMLSI